MNSATWDLYGLDFAIVCVAAAVGLLILAVGYVVWDTARRRGRSPRCSKCGYMLVGLTERRCPECGEPFSEWGFIDNTADARRLAPDYQASAAPPAAAVAHEDGEGE
jgi:hypothetical protein